MVHVRGYGDINAIGTSVGVEVQGKVGRDIGVHIGREGARVKWDRGCTANKKHRYILRYDLVSDLISEKFHFISVSISD
jgi:hypothetical protein